MNMQDANVMSFAMDEDQLKAFVFGHMGITEESKKVLKTLASYDRLAIGRYTLMQAGSNVELFGPERADVIRQGKEYYELWNAVESQNYYADK